MTTIPARISGCRADADAYPNETGLSFTVALTVQISAGDLTRIDITRPITITQETPND